MGHRGPIPQPSVIEIAEGSPGKRPVNRDDLSRVRLLRSVRPIWTGPLERSGDAWCAFFRRMRVLTEADGIALGNRRQTYSTLTQAQEKVTKQGILYKASSGYIMQSPLLSVVNQCVDTISKLSRESGLTPAARSRIFVLRQTAVMPYGVIQTYRGRALQVSAIAFLRRMTSWPGTIFDVGN